MPAESNIPSALPKTREIYDVLDGDARFHSNELDEDANPPYQSGPMLVETLNRIGLPSAYDSSNRWMYVERLIGHCLETQQIPKMFAYFFDLRRFHKDLQGLAAEEIDRRHKAIVAAAIGAINGELLFGGHELRRLGNTYSVAPHRSLAGYGDSLNRANRPSIRERRSRKSTKRYDPGRIRQRAYQSEDASRRGVLPSR